MSEPTVIYKEEPFIARYDNIVSGSECRTLIELSKHQLQPAKVIGQTDVVTSEFRKSDFAWFHHLSHDVVRQVSERVASIVGQPLHYAEQLQVAKYGVGGKFGAHFDTYDLTTVAGKKFYAEGGQRLYTALLYLNTVNAGGETYFPELNLDISPTEGTLIVFENCRKGTNEAHPLSFHGSRELREGEKWIATLWFRERPQYEPSRKAEPPVPAAETKPYEYGAEVARVEEQNTDADRDRQPVYTADRSVELPAKEPGRNMPHAKVVAQRGFDRREIHMRGFKVTTDIVAEGDQYSLGPDPAEMMLGALGSCIAQVALSLAADRGIALEYLEVDVTGRMTAADRWSPPALNNIAYKLVILSPSPTDDILKLHKAVERSCPSLQLLAEPQQIAGTFSHTKTNG